MVGFVDRESEIGRRYESRRKTSIFYRGAHFHTTDEVLDLILRVGFRNVVLKQALIPGEREDVVRDGYGAGSFVAVRGDKPH